MRRRHTNLLVVAIGMLVLSGCAPWMPMDARDHMAPGHMEDMMGQRGATDGLDAPDPVVGAREVLVEAGDLWFEPDRIEVSVGEPVNIAVTNVGGIYHDFVISDLGFGLDVDTGQTASGGLEVAEPGSYTFVCTVPGHEVAGMRGTLVAVNTPGA